MTESTDFLHVHVAILHTHTSVWNLGYKYRRGKVYIHTSSTELVLKHLFKNSDHGVLAPWK